MKKREYNFLEKRVNQIKTEVIFSKNIYISGLVVVMLSFAFLIHLEFSKTLKASDFIWVNEVNTTTECILAQVSYNSTLNQSIGELLKGYLWAFEGDGKLPVSCEDGTQSVKPGEITKMRIEDIPGSFGNEPGKQTALVLFNRTIYIPAHLEVRND